MLLALLPGIMMIRTLTLVVFTIVLVARLSTRGDAGFLSFLAFDGSTVQLSVLDTDSVLFFNLRHRRFVQHSRHRQVVPPLELANGFLRVRRHHPGRIARQVSEV